MSSKEALWPCLPKTKAKLEILHGYLGAWFGILAQKGYRHVFYVDGFCGPGRYSSGEDGSPVIAAQTANRTAERFPEFSASLIFVDKDPKALVHLQSMSAIRDHHPRIIIDIKEGTFSDEIGGIVAELESGPLSPTFSFVDPFGFSHSPLDKLKRLMHNKSSEIFVNLMCGFMNRFKEHDDDRITASIQDMVGESDLARIIGADDPIDAICLAFEKNLRRIGPYTLKFMMRDEKNIRDNAFFFCGRHARGFEKIKQAMWKIDPIHGNSFSAYRALSSNQFQDDLFETGPQTQALSALLIENFSGKKNVPVHDIFEWVIEETESFLPTFVVNGCSALAALPWAYL